MGSYKGIIQLYVVKYTSKQLRSVYDKRDPFNMVSYINLPEYFIETNSGELKNDGYFQFVSEDDNESYYGLDIQCSDSLINEELSNAGFDLLFKNDRFFCKEFGEIINSDFHVINAESMNIPIPINILVELDWVCSNDIYGTDCDLHTKILGYYNNNFELKQFTNE